MGCSDQKFEGNVMARDVHLVLIYLMPKDIPWDDMTDLMICEHGT